MRQRIRLLKLVVAAAVVVTLLTTGQRAATAAPTLQTSGVDAVECVNAAPAPSINVGNVGTQGTQNCAAEASPLTANVAATIQAGVAIPAGQRLGKWTNYNGAAWQVVSAGNGTVVGGYHEFVDLLCDQNEPATSNVDTIADSTGIGQDEPYVQRTTLSGAGTGVNGSDETYLDSLLPPSVIAGRVARYRAEVNTIYLGGFTTLSLAVPSPINVVTVAPTWGSSDASITVSADSSAPTTQLLCIDSPNSGLSSLGNVATIEKTPTLPGFYPRWTTYISSPDLSSGAISFEYFFDCKVVGTPPGGGADADGDCWSNQPQPVDVTGDGLADFTLPADTNDANADLDGDGLIDGLEVTWGSCPDNTVNMTTFGGINCSMLGSLAAARDTDSDGRSDLEEIAGPSQLLSNPVVADTDSDGVPDGGLILDANGDGQPDIPDNNGDGNADASPCDSTFVGGDHTRCGFTAPTLTYEGDNCSSIANAGQVNMDAILLRPDPFGDACDIDKDNDGIPDVAEANFVYQNGTNPNDRQCRSDGDANDDPASGPGFWKNAAPFSDQTLYPVTPLNPLNGDSDGDGFLDGRECQGSRATGLGDGGSNPNDVLVTPRLNPTGDLDGDTLGSLGAERDQEQTVRTINFSNSVPCVVCTSEDIDGDTLDGMHDSDSDGDLIPDGIEYWLTGTSPAAFDSDFNLGLPGIHTASVSDGVKLAAFRKAGGGQIDNGSGIASNDVTDPASPGPNALSRRGLLTPNGLDADRDGLIDSSGAESCTNGLGTFATLINDDFTDLVTVAGDPTSWDSDGDGVRDGAECIANTNPLLKSSKPTTAACGGATDADGDGLPASAEKCKWGTSDVTADSDGDGVKDCVEANDTNGDLVQNFSGDTINSAKAANGIIQKTGDFDLNGDGAVNYPGDTILSAKMANHVGGICP